MIKPDECYVNLGCSTVIQNYFDTNLNNLEYGKHLEFAVSVIPRDVYLSEPLLKEVDTQHKILRCAIMRLDKYRCYNWHIDKERGAGINLLLTPNIKSLVYFGERDTGSRYNISFIEMKYEPNTFYLFNTQISHTVYNFDETRYVFTLEFEEDKDKLSFNQLKEGVLKKYANL